MTSKVSAVIADELYKTVIQTATNTLVSDEPVSNGGLDKGFNPFELLAASLASCTCATLKMYANRKQWPIEKILVDVTFDRDVEANTSTFERTITVIGNLTEEQKQRLLVIANACPVHKIFAAPMIVNTQFIN